MTTNTILQLARFNSTDTPSNSEWVTNLKDPVILNQGDSITVRQAYIDSRLNSSGSIVIPNDIELSMTYYFYMMFPCDGASRQVDPGPTARKRDTADQPFGFADVAIEAPIDYVNFLGTLNQGDPNFYLYQGDMNDYAINTGQPHPPNYQPPKGSYPQNQSLAAEIPMLLVEWNGPQNHKPATDPTANINQKPITRTWTYTLLAGTYNPNELADILTKKMAEIQPNKTQPSFNPYTQFGVSTPSNLNEFLIRGTQVTGPTWDVQDNDGSQGTFAPPYSIDTVVQRYGFNFSSNSPAFAEQPLVLGAFANFCSDIRFNTKYLDTQILSDIDTESELTNPVTFIPSHFSSEYSFTLSQGDNTNNGYHTHQQCALEYESPIVGASEISIEFNTNTGVFQFTYLHTPILQLPTSENGGGGGSQPVEVVKIIKTTNLNMYDPSYNVRPSGEVKICEQTRHSGIIFQSMEPYSFWHDTLGFDVDNITFDPKYVWGQDRQMTFKQFNSVTTSGYVGIENNFNFVNTDDTQVLPNTNAPSYLSAFPTNQDSKIIGELSYTSLLNSSRWFLDHYILQNGKLYESPEFDYDIFIGPLFYEEYSSALIATNPLTALQAPLSQISSTGHYLINIDDYKNTKNDFINDNSVYNIKSIVSNYYLSQGAFATQPFQDSAIYVHNSPIPKVINTFKVRLIDPITMGNASNIGPNSSVYLQVNKIISEVAVLQTY